MKTPPENTYNDIPGTFVFDAQHSRKGYHLNMLMMSLIKPENREAMKADEEAYMDKFKLTKAQRRVIKNRDWNGMLEEGGNVYYTLKLAAADGTPYEAAYAAMSGTPRDVHREMMLNGGRSPEGNMYLSDWESKK
jgi:protocatechuate 4,5-dioxygenase alpha chain